MRNLAMPTELTRSSGKVKPIVDSVYAFGDVHAAYGRIMSQRAGGKVVVRVDPDAE